ncbi:YwmB family TATA-box binding protein [Bacillus licheniformis]|uniref:YwmB family TATA-box binding protein n=1 Tax=Bacillus licheniformis TaxID=1402 RepID=UPI002E1DD598|nr:YwmB family TATA-box binding protein [Bacillus licheniformis]
MKNLLMITIIFFSIIIFKQIIYTVEASEIKILTDLNEIAKKNEIDIIDWSVYTKKTLRNVSKDIVKKHIQEVKLKGDIFSWETEKDEHHTTITGTFKNNKRNEKVSKSIIPSKETYTMTFSHRVEGKGQLLSDKSNVIIVPFKYKQSNQYVTVKGKIKKAIKLENLEKKIFRDADAGVVEGLKESNFRSISGYTNKWGTGIKAAHGKTMNFQLGLREARGNGLIQVTMGAPIITLEY